MSGASGCWRRSMPAAISGAGCTPSWPTIPRWPARAGSRGVEIHDLRRPPADLPVASGKAKAVEPFVILTVGTDCNVGKMTSQLQITKALNDAGPPHPFRRHRPDRHHDRGLGHRGGRGGRRLHRRRGGMAGARGQQGRRHRAGGRAGEPQSPRLLRRHLRAAARLLPRCADPLPPGHPRVHRRLPQGRLAQDSAARATTCSCTRRWPGSCTRPGPSASRSTPTT